MREVSKVEVYGIFLRLHRGFASVPVHLPGGQALPSTNILPLATRIGNSASPCVVKFVIAWLLLWRLIITCELKIGNFSVENNAWPRLGSACFSSRSIVSQRAGELLTLKNQRGGGLKNGLIMLIFIWLYIWPGVGQFSVINWVNFKILSGNLRNSINKDWRVKKNVQEL